MESNSEESEARRAGDEADVEIEECPDEEEADTDLETDRLLGQQRTDDQGFYDDKVSVHLACDVSPDPVVLINRCYTDKSFSYYRSYSLCLCRGGTSDYTCDNIFLFSLSLYTCAYAVTFFTRYNVERWWPHHRAFRDI